MRLFIASLTSLHDVIPVVGFPYTFPILFTDGTPINQQPAQGTILDVVEQ